MSKIIAHRGWSEGSGKDWQENTISAILKSVDFGAHGIELDLRWDGGRIVLSHDKVVYDSPVYLDEVLEYIKTHDLYLFAEFKECSEQMFEYFASAIRENDLSERCYVFGFKSVAKYFPWDKYQDIKKGIIVEYPWKIGREVCKYKPSLVAIGWDNGKSWTKTAFRLYWSLFSLNKLKKKYSIEILAGVCINTDDIDILKSNGADYITVDFENL